MERIDSVEDEDDAGSDREREKAGQALQEAGEALKTLRTLCQETATYWDMKEKRVFGKLVSSPSSLHRTRTIHSGPCHHQD